ncbi:PH domain-containing protein [Streptomyces sp. NPDC013178]|uniref:PH domain-containing protein n=1 Tax=Streptomyces sp. NPDC013178 TaxID=3155118 RepID=UPI0033D29EB6
MTGAQPAPDRSQWRRLHPRMLVVQPLHEFVRALPILVATFLVGAGSGSGSGEKWSLVVSVLAVLLGPVRWYTTQFRIADGKVQLRRGVLQQQVTTVPLERIRSVDVTAHPLHRVLGLARVEIGTGSRDTKSKNEDRLKLDALTVAQAHRLRSELFLAGAPRSGHAELARARTTWMRYAPLNIGGPVLLGLIAVILHQAHVDPWDTAPAHALAARLRGPDPWGGIAEAALVALVCATVASTLFYAVMFGDFRLVRLPDGTLQTTHGLLTTRTVTLQESRVRGVEVAETLPVRAVGGARCLALTTGLRGSRGGALLVPSAPAEQVRQVAAEVIRDPAPVHGPLKPHPRRALRRRLVRALVSGTVVAALFAVATARGTLPDWPWPLVVALFPLGVLLALDGYRGLGHTLAGPYLVGQLGVLVRRRWALSRDGVVGLRLRRSVFQRRAGLVTVIATTAAGRGRYFLLDITSEDAVRIALEVMPEAVEPFVEAPSPVEDTSASTGTRSAGAG